MALTPKDFTEEQRTLRNAMASLLSHLPDFDGDVYKQATKAVKDLKERVRGKKE